MQNRGTRPKGTPLRRRIANGRVGFLSRNRSEVDVDLIKRIKTQLNLAGKNDKMLKLHVNQANNLLYTALHSHTINYETLKAIDDLITDSKASMTDNAYLVLNSTLALGWAQVSLRKDSPQFQEASFGNFEKKLKYFSLSTQAYFEKLKSRILEFTLTPDRPTINFDDPTHRRLLDSLDVIDASFVSEIEELERRKVLEHELSISIKRDSIKFDFRGLAPAKHLDRYDRSNHIRKSGQLPSIDLSDLISSFETDLVIARIATCLSEGAYLKNLLKELRRIEDKSKSWNKPKYGIAPISDKQLAGASIKIVSGLLHNPEFTDGLTDQAKALLLSPDESSAGVVAVLIDLEILPPEDVWEYFIKPNIDESKLMPSEKLDPKLVLEIMAIRWPHTQLVVNQLSELTTETAVTSFAR